MDLSIDIMGAAFWSYSYSGTNRSLLSSIFVTPGGRLPAEDIDVFPRVSFRFPVKIAEVWEGQTRTIESRGANIGSRKSWERIRLDIDYSALASISEHIIGKVVVEIVNARDGEVIAAASKDVTLLAANSFRFEPDYFDSLAAFVLPSDPYVAEILVKAQRILERDTGSPSLEGYQSEVPVQIDPRHLEERSRAYKIAKAIYEALSQEPYVYSNPPGNFFLTTQRVRTPSQVKSDNAGTCLDTTVLMAACLAQAGLEPVLFIIQGHAFAGYITGEHVNANVFGEKSVQFVKNVCGTSLTKADDNDTLQMVLHGRLIQPIETTTTGRGSDTAFHEACTQQNSFSIHDDSLLESVVLVSNAWRDGITPPVSLREVPLTGFVHVPGQKSDLDDPIEVETDFSFGTSVELDESTMSPEEKARPPRVRQWMSSLLDLGGRNPLLKIKPAQTLEFPVPPSLLGKIDDLLYTPRKKLDIISPLGLPREWMHEGATDGKYDTWIKSNLKLVYPSHAELNPIQRQAEEELRLYRGAPGDPIPDKFKKGSRDVIEKVRSDPGHDYHKLSDALLLKILTDGRLGQLHSDLTKKLRAIDSKASEVMLMTGNNSLYLALGSLSWTEQSSSRGTDKTSEWCAPLYLYPVILEGGKGSPFTIRLDPNGEATPNYPLHEKLKRAPYNLDVQELVNPAMDDSGIDFDRMIQAISQRLKDAHLNNFAVQPRVFLGVFDYSTFRLWNDFKTSWKKMTEVSAVARHLILTPNQDFGDTPPEPEPRLEPVLPIAADDSQRQAVQWALDGKSFRLEGPPGTGKSQTITNLLASCIAHNKKVLFIAEKQTALNAVKERLDDAGLGKYCLNLHAKGDSDTRMRKKISEALTTALAERVDPMDATWAELTHRMRTEEAALDRYREGLHQVRVGGLSTWEANEQLMQVGSGTILDLPDSFIENFEHKWPELLDACAHIDAAMDLVGDPTRHIWRMATSSEAAHENSAAISEAVQTVLGILTDQSSAKGITEILDEFGVESLSLIAEGHALLGSRGVRAADELDALVPELNGSFEAAQELDALVARLQVISAALAPYEGIISPMFLRRDNHQEIWSVLLRLTAVDADKGIAGVVTSWTALAHDFDALGAGVTPEILEMDDVDAVQSALASYDAAVASGKLDELLVAMRSLALAAERQSANIRPGLLGRNDLMNIAMLLKDAEDAGAMTKGRKFKALRDTLGSDAKSEDNRLLAASLNELLKLTKETDAIRLALQTQYPAELAGSVVPWELTSINEFAEQAEKHRVHGLRDAAAMTQSPTDDAKFVAVVRKLLEMVPRVRQCRRELSETAPSLDPASFKPWENQERARLLASFRDSLIEDIRKCAGPDITDPASPLLVDGLRAWIENRDEVIRLQDSEFARLLPGYDAAFRVWDTNHVQRLATARTELRTFFARVSNPRLIVHLKSSLGSSSDSLGTSATEFMRAWAEFESIVKVTEASRQRWLDGRTLSRAVSEEFPRLVADAGEKNRYLELERWGGLLEAIGRLDPIGLGNQKDALLSGAVHISLFASDARRSALRAAFEKLSTEAGMDRFDRKRHEQRIANFEKALGDAQDLLRTRIPGLVYKRRSAKSNPTGAEVGATSALLKGLKPGRGDKTPIRDLISRYGNALADAMPCFLMSPDSVATLVPVGAIDFDLVIFDEASQIRTSHAVGALGRGRAGIVVGDRQQMPPSNTFSSNSGAFVDVDDFDETEESEADDSDGVPAMFAQPEAAQDSESILTEFYSCNFPSMQLLCHYRSRDEVLISFSNSNIYDEPMLTFPSTLGLESDALRYVHVSGGQFERNKNAVRHTFKNTNTTLPSLRTNIVEAQAVVDLVLQYLRDPKRNARLAADPSGKCESIIVVTFNVQQKTLIEEMLRNEDQVLYERVTKETPADDEAGKKAIPARLKIRNLENVQGDEAETVIFSVAFTKDPSAKNFSLNWGPVTQAGGERRLNVAVTRAQKEMIVFASFLPSEMIGAGRKVSPEAQMVYRFLQLAYNGANQVGDVGISVPRSSHIERIAADLRSRGYETHTQLGLSTLRVDIAVRKPGNPNWQLAIMVDDSCWSERGSAFQREVLPRQVLPGLGWEKVMRIWLPSWIDDRDGLLQDIDDFFNGVDAPEPEAETMEIDTPVIIREEPDGADAAPTPTAQDTVNSLHFPFTAFEPTLLGDVKILDHAGFSKVSHGQFMDIINSILLTEAPIEAERLAKLFFRCVNFNRVSPERVQQVLSHLDPATVVADALGTFVWHPDQDIENWRNYRVSLDAAPRSSDEISVAEYTNALVELVSTDPPVSYEDAARTVAATFGFKKLAKLIRANIDTAFGHAINAGRIRRVGDDLYPGQ